MDQRQLVVFVKSVEPSMIIQVKMLQSNFFSIYVDTSSNCLKYEQV